MTDLIPTLRPLVEASGLAPDKLCVALETDTHHNIRVKDRHTIPVTDGEKAVSWPVPTLIELFRSSQAPPADMDHYPEAYTPHFFFIESHVLSVCDAKGDRTDQEMEEIYSMLRRRPDGRSLGVVHDFVWQVSALLLGTRVMSAAEFEALITALEHSTRRWALRPVSRNYAAYLHQTLGGMVG
jgi:hypothetical protein